MTPADSRALRLQLQREFPDFNLNDWYVQYRGLKAGYPDAVLLYRLGDFYETFDDDAKLAADLLNITLTYKKFASHKRDKSEQRCPMAGMPYHSIDGYITKLVGAGYRVAVAEQISETPSMRSDTRPRSRFAAGIEPLAAARDMVDRKVVRVITPGTVVDGGLLAAEQNNYLAAVIVEGGRIGLAYADLSTGEFAATEFAGERGQGQAQGELARLRAAEVLVPDKAELRLDGLEPSSARLESDLEFLTKEERELLLPGERVARRVERENTARWAHGHITALPAWRWELRTARDALLSQFGVQSLASFGLGDRPLAARAAGAIVQYARETQNGAVANLNAIRAYTTGDVMFLDPQTRRNLELLEGSGGRTKGSLVSVLDQTRTPMGARLLRRWIQQPLLDIGQLRVRQDAVERFVEDAILRASVRAQLKLVGDMERVVNRVIQGVSVTTPRDMARLREGLRALPELAEALGGWVPNAEGRTLNAAGTEQPAPAGEPAADASWLFADDDGFPAPQDSAAQQVAGTQDAAPVPSLREQREARRRVQPRYADEDDLFGEGAWDEANAEGRTLNDEPNEANARREMRNAKPGAVPAAPASTTAHSAPAEARVLEGDGGQAPQGAQPSAFSVQRSALDPCSDVLAFLESALDDDPPALLGSVDNYLRTVEGEPPRRVIRPGFEPRIDQIVLGNRKARDYFSRLEERERERTGIKSLRVDYTKVFGYFIEVPRSFAHQVPPEYIRKQTISTGERYFTDEMKRLEEQLEGAKSELAEVERRTFARICATVAEQGARLLATARLLAEIDVYAALAEAAVRGRYVRPSLHEDTRLRIVAGRHPVVEQTLDEAFVPNDISVDTENEQILVITGANMTGKSTTLRQVALIALMAQIGSFVPADAAEVGLVDRIFTRIGAQDDIATGQSTFMVEMTETAALLAQSTWRSLVILDEVGRGTSTYDGMAIARALIEYIHNEPRLGCRTLFATHYHELTELERELARLRNYHMAAVEQDGRVVFLHELRRGGADRSYGIHVAELAGIPRPVIRRASELLAALERDAQRPERTASERSNGGAPDAERATGQLSLFDLAPNPVVELIRRLNINDLTPLQALNKLAELQRLVSRGDP
ncbi:MAG TPA: DNA mismatch repair protein MutS [Roseiflexaceae bacterium]|nr:DNA mismatch repair protein MutS [Roseiflexaceae bacterium]